MSTTISNIEKEIEAFADYLPLITREEPSVFERQFTMQLQQINEMSLAYPEKRHDLIRYCSNIFAKETDKNNIAYRSRVKPLGYAGDYLLIDWIYTNKTATDYKGKLWDEFSLRLPGTQTVKYRKDYLCKVLSKLAGEKTDGLSVLNIACGPCRDLAEAMELAGTKAAGSHLHCVDVEKKAIGYAKELLKGYELPHVSFQWEIANALRLRTHRRYDLVWAAGLFDYLDNRCARILLKRMWDWTAEGGRIVFGNYHPGNPSRNIVEWSLEWFLTYRTKEETQTLCEEAGIPQDCVSFEQEPLGICVFCVVTRKNCRLG